MAVAELIFLYGGTVFLRGMPSDELAATPAICIPVREIPRTQPPRYTRVYDVYDARNSGRMVTKGLLARSAAENISGIVVLPYGSHATRDAILARIGVTPIVV